MRHWSYILAMAVALLTLSNLTRAGDREVSEQIAERLQASGQLRGYDVRVKFEDGTAWLRGRVANQQQMAAALSMAFQTQGVKQVVNGLTVRSEPWQRPQTASTARSLPVDYSVERARLVAPTPITPIPALPQPSHSLSHSVSAPAGYSEIQSLETADSSPGVFPTTASTEPVERIASAIPETPATFEPLRRPGFTSTPEALPTTAQKACYVATTMQAHVTDLHMATTLTGAAEPMLLPDESAVSTGEAFASDGLTDPPALLATNSEGTAIPSARMPSRSEVLQVPRLIQSLPEPTRRSWASLSEHGLPTMRASVDR